MCATDSIGGDRDSSEQACPRFLVSFEALCQLHLNKGYDEKVTDEKQLKRHWTAIGQSFSCRSYFLLFFFALVLPNSCQVLQERTVSASLRRMSFSQYDKELLRQSKFVRQRHTCVSVVLARSRSVGSDITWF